MPFGFSNGCVELALKKPPPFWPSCLMASWLATGPPGISWVAPDTVVTWWKPPRFWMTPWLISTMATTAASGRKTRTVPRTRSTQKLPTTEMRRRARERTSAIATHSPTTGDTKFCTASPAIWLRWLRVSSPP